MYYETIQIDFNSDEAIYIQPLKKPHLVDQTVTVTLNLL